MPILSFFTAINEEKLDFFFVLVKNHFVHFGGPK